MEFYGVVMDVQDNQLRFLALVFELCKASLKNHIFKNEENKPWRTNSAAIITCRWGVEILDALEFIHSKKIVHRDLKLDNVLVSHFNCYMLQISPSNHSNRGRKGLIFQCVIFFCVLHWALCSKSDWVGCPLLNYIC